MESVTMSDGKHQQDRSYFRRPPVPWLVNPAASECYSLFHDEKPRTIPLHLKPSQRSHATYQSSSAGWLLLTETRRQGLLYDTLLLNPITGKKVLLPPLETSWSDQYHMVLSSTPTDPSCLVALPHGQGFALCRPGDREWTYKHLPEPEEREDGWIHPCSELDRTGRRDRVINIVASGSKLYGLTFTYGLLVLDYAGSGQVEEVEMDCMQHSWRLMPGALSAMVESEGEIFLVSVWDSNQSMGAAEEYEPDMEVAVFRANLEVGCRVWERVWSLGGRVFFVGEGGSVSVAASGSDGRGDRMYIARPKLTFSPGSKRKRWRWMEVELPDGAIAYCSDDVGTELNCRLLWLMPSQD